MEVPARDYLEEFMQLWRDLEGAHIERSAKASDISHIEERTVVDLFICHLELAYRDSITVKKNSGVHEKRTGWDFAVLVEQRNVLVQAKKCKTMGKLVKQTQLNTLKARVLGNTEAFYAIFVSQSPGLYFLSVNVLDSEDAPKLMKQSIQDLLDRNLLVTVQDWMSHVMKEASIETYAVEYPLCAERTSECHGQLGECAVCELSYCEQHLSECLSCKHLTCGDCGFCSDCEF